MLVWKRQEVQKVPLRSRQGVFLPLFKDRLQRPCMKPQTEVSFTSAKGRVTRDADMA